MQREFIVAEEEDEFGEIILSLAAIEVGIMASLADWSCNCCSAAEAPQAQQQLWNSSMCWLVGHRCRLLFGGC